MFSKALFKQSCKANGVMWIIITFAVCLMLSCVMLISGSGNIGKVKNSLEDTIITAEINANIEKRSINYYSIGTDGLKQYDKLFVQNYQSLSTYAESVDTWFAGQPSEEQFPAYTNTVQGLYAQTFNNWLAQKPTKTGEMTEEQYSQLLAGWMAKRPSQSSTDVLAKVCYMATASDLQTYEQQKALEVNKDYVAGSDESNEIVGAAICALDPTLNESISELYTTNNIDIPASYDVQSLLAHLSAGDIETYLASSERAEYIQNRTQIASSVYIAGNMTTEKISINLSKHFLVMALQKKNMTLLAIHLKTSITNLNQHSFLSKADMTTNLACLMKNIQLQNKKQVKSMQMLLRQWLQI